MDTSQETVHTTLNLSTPLIREAKKLFADRTKTEIIHEALERLITTEKLLRHLQKWAGKGHFKDYESAP